MSEADTGEWGTNQIQHDAERYARPHQQVEAFHSAQALGSDDRGCRGCNDGGRKGHEPEGPREPCGFFLHDRYPAMQPAKLIAPRSKVNNRPNPKVRPMSCAIVVLRCLAKMNAETKEPASKLETAANNP